MMNLATIKIKLIFSIILSGLGIDGVLGQNQNSIWIFGDSAGIDFFNLNNPLSISSAMDGRGSCVSISDSNGELLFYAYTRANTSDTSTRVLNHQHVAITNGEQIVGNAWYNELIIIPAPGIPNNYYLFSAGVSNPAHPGLYYSIIDMNANGGLGEVTLKNVQIHGIYSLDGIAAVMHGNGRDWWIINKQEGYQTTPNNTFRIFLISPSGVSSPLIQNIGEFTSTGAGCVSFNKDGTKMVMTTWKNMIQVIDFDRCTGLLSNAVTIEPEHLNESGSHWGSCFSPDGNLIYVSRMISGANFKDSWLYQYDLQSGNISGSRDTIFHDTLPTQFGLLRVGPDDKIYLTSGYYGYYYPYADSIYYLQNMNLSVINQPNNLGLSCDLQPFSFNLVGKRSYYGLPNNPDYILGPQTGSQCDTLSLTSQEYRAHKGNLHVFLHPGWQTAFINAQGLSGKNYLLNIFDVQGKIIYSENGKLNSAFLTKSYSCSHLGSGMYIVVVETEKERLVKRFMIN